MAGWSLWLAGLLRSDWTPRWGQQAVWLVLRMVAGGVMIHNGLDKLVDIPGFAEAYVQVIGLPFPILLSYVAAYTEIVGSILLILGLGSRLAALGLLATMAVAIFHHVKVAGFSIPYLELSSLYAACFLFFVVNGAGLISLDQWLGEWLSHRRQSRRIQSLEQSLHRTPVPQDTLKL
ncbi:MAG: DoxX family protein [Gloeomargarita sp. DG02_4_bins_56]